MMGRVWKLSCRAKWFLENCLKNVHSGKGLQSSKVLFIEFWTDNVQHFLRSVPPQPQVLHWEVMGYRSPCSFINPLPICLAKVGIRRITFHLPPFKQWSHHSHFLLQLCSGSELWNLESYCIISQTAAVREWSMPAHSGDHGFFFGCQLLKLPSNPKMNFH